MPKHNILYRFIAKTIELAQADGHKFSAKINSNKVPYYLLRLPINKNSTLIFGDVTYILEEHHISIYQPIIDRSQYHYTAILSTKQGDKYLLHVYFNEKDKLSNKPYLDSMRNNERVAVHLTDAQENMLIDQAMEECQPPILALRRQHLKFIAELDKRYTQSVLKLETLSKNLRQNYEAYVQQSEATKQILTELCLYHSGQEYRNILRLIKRTVPLLKPEPKQIAPAAPQPTIEKVQKSTLSSQPLVNVTETKQKQSPQPQEPSVQKPSLATHIEALETTWNDFIEAYRSDSQNSVKQFLFFNATLSTLCSEEMSGHFDCSAAAIERLEFMMMVRTEYAKKLLTELLLKHDFLKAESLKGFVPLLEKRLLNISLSVGNPKLLNFLLTHSDFALNTHEVADGLTPVPYCLAKCNGKNSMVECLEILISHGASLMVRYQGLPVAYHILAVANHPLRSAFITTAKETIGSKEFLAMLIRECERCLAQGQDEFINKQKILQFIIKVQNDLKQLSVSGRNAAQLAQSTEKALKALTEKMGSQLSEELLNNPSILRCKEEYYSALEEYREIAPRREYNALLKERNDMIADSTQIIEILGQADFVKMNLLNETVNSLQRATRIIALKTELHRKNAEISKPNAKQNSKQRQLEAEAQQLAEEINNLIREHNQNKSTSQELVNLRKELEEDIRDITKTLALQARLLRPLHDELKQLCDEIRALPKKDDEISRLKIQKLIDKRKLTKELLSDIQETEQTLTETENLLKIINLPALKASALPQNAKPKTPSRIIAQTSTVPPVSPENTSPNILPGTIINDIPPENIKKVNEEVKEKVNNWLFGTMM